MASSEENAQLVHTVHKVLGTYLAGVDDVADVLQGCYRDLGKTPTPLSRNTLHCVVQHSVKNIFTARRGTQ